MNTRKILLISSDKSLIEIIRISALTLTKLNCQVSFESTSGFEEGLSKSKEKNLDLILIDRDLKTFNVKKLIETIRREDDSKNKKIILLCSDQIDRKEIFSAGCDSIMTKEEFRKAVNNILTF